MAKRRATNKSAAIREYAANNPEAKPKQIAEALAKDGIKVKTATISTVLSNAKRKAGKPGRRKLGVDFDTLMQAKNLAQQLGGIDNARAALDALSRLIG